MSGTISICLNIKNLIRHRLLAEQLAVFHDHRITDAATADITLCEENENAGMTSSLRVLIPDEPLRLGEIVDKMHYALTKRAEYIESTSVIPLGPFTLMPNENILCHTATNQSIYLTDKEKQLIGCLYHAPNHQMERGQLLQSVWKYADNAETHTFETHLYRLRQKLEPFNAAWLISSVGDGQFALCFKSPITEKNKTR